MAGIAAFLLSIKALAAGGIFKELCYFPPFKMKKGRRPDSLAVNRILSGWAAGLRPGVALSATGFGYIGYLAGAVALAAALVFKILFARERRRSRMKSRIIAFAALALLLLLRPWHGGVRRRP
jgi:hypothetical protein